MFHKAIDLKFKEGTTIEVRFQDGKIIQYDVSALFPKYPQLCALKDRDLFLSGHLSGFYGIIWNNDLDLEAETVYQEGVTVRCIPPAANTMVGNALIAARAGKGISQTELSQLSGIDQSDISKIERGLANPSVNTLKRIAKALGTRLTISFEQLN